MMRHRVVVEVEAPNAAAALDAAGDVFANMDAVYRMAALREGVEVWSIEEAACGG